MFGNFFPNLLNVMVVTNMMYDSNIWNSVKVETNWLIPLFHRSD